MQSVTYIIKKYFLLGVLNESVFVTCLYFNWIEEKNCLLIAEEKQGVFI